MEAKPPQSPHGDGKLHLYNYHLDEFLEITFRKNGILDEKAVEQVNQLLRSRDNSEVIKINPQLLDWMDFIQDHYGADTLEIISGYRRKEFNDELLKEGHTVSPVSLHTQGNAIDIHIDEIREESLRDFLLSLQLGGVGYYAQLDFVHMDAGPVRRWGENSNKRKLVGVLDPQNSTQLTSDKNDYLPKEIPQWKWSETADFSKIKDMHLEHFWRGKWENCSPPLKIQKSFSFPMDQIHCEKSGPEKKFGKYRVIFTMDGNEKELSSNEFYLKKE